MTKSDVKTDGRGPVGPAGPNALPEAPSAPPAEEPAPAPGQLRLPEGTIQLPPGTAARMMRFLREHQGVQDCLYSFLEGRGDTGPYTLVVPVFLLVRPPDQPSQ